jgi:hypothetical protein
MGLSSDFENHIFISYAHRDNLPLSEGQKGWIESLHRALEIRLGQTLGADPRIWRDPKLGGNDYFADSLATQLSKAAILVTVLSPSYVNSEWCSRELKEFYGFATKQGGVRVDDKSRQRPTCRATNTRRSCKGCWGTSFIRSTLPPTFRGSSAR